MWRDPARRLTVGCGPAPPMHDQRRGECDQHKPLRNHPGGPGGFSVAHERDRRERLARQASEHESHAAATGEAPKQVVGTGHRPSAQAPAREHQDVAGVAREVVPQ